jgi:hypothetical protein
MTTAVLTQYLQPMRTSHSVHVAAVVIALAAAMSSACSKNEAATSACSSSTNGTTCESCCKANGANGYKYMSACSCLGGNGNAASTAPATTVSFTGSYNSTWGKADFMQTGEHVNVKYARGTMSCTASGNALDCDWDEGAGGTGKAKLVKETSGTIRGTWGKGSSASNGGAWVFTP